MIPVMIVPLLARPELLNRMVASIDHPVDTLVVIDNGKCLVNPPFVPKVRTTHLLTMPANMGVAGSWNLGIKVTPFAPWWLIVNFDVEWPAGSLEQFDREDAAHCLALSGGSPEWCAFSVGEDVVAQVGLFDEYLHPAYYEDDDYLRRCEAAGAPIVRTGVPVRHTNSSTLAAGFSGRNGATFAANADYYGSKVARGDLSEGRWSLRRRREQTWD